MAKLRYLIAGLMTCLIHGIALSYTPQKNTMALSAEEGRQAIHIQLLAVTPPLEDIPVKEKISTIEPKKTEYSGNKTPPSQPQKPTLNPGTAQIKVIPEKKPNVTKKKAIFPHKESKLLPHKEVFTKRPVVKNADPNVVTTNLASTKIEQETHKPTVHKVFKDSAPMLVKKPNFSAKPTPVTYPKLARKKGLEGKVMIEVWLDAQGKQIKQLIIKSSGHKVLDERALYAIKQWHFSRKVEQGQAIAHRVQIPINFQLQ